MVRVHPSSYVLLNILKHFLDLIKKKFNNVVSYNVAFSISSKVSFHLLINQCTFELNILLLPWHLFVTYFIACLSILMYFSFLFSDNSNICYQICCLEIAQLSLQIHANNLTSWYCHSDLRFFSQKTYIQSTF